MKHAKTAAQYGDETSEKHFCDAWFARFPDNDGVYEAADIYCEVSLTDEYIDSDIDTWEAVP